MSEKIKLLEKELKRFYMGGTKSDVWWKNMTLLIAEAVVEYNSLSGSKKNG